MLLRSVFYLVSPVVKSSFIPDLILRGIASRNVTDLEFGNLDADKAIAAILKIEGKLEDNSSVDAQFQCALLSTSATGQRRVRCHNLTLPVTRVIGNIFRSADMDATMALLTKQYIAQIVQVHYEMLERL
ncbi:hypothetical protein Pst134EA_032559 [Puccinia striiformis f. sp. tritici]|uniref:uncharacterized protein n=1 Tax=Puccinia striiformis f. sp. tritici TaxID=168172 RepID=UPI002008DE1F|nr:uncharacterized protein Pst134EA_032559 [Puccinia striiformis f. sp. tritici]KAH9443612.1 hypothetical protein Pst134EA_032559 [Puccinia striiformis f. sp. tritici]